MAATGTETPNGRHRQSAGSLRAALARLSNQQKIMLMVAIAAVIALLVASSTWLKQADYRILFSNITSATAAPSSPRSSR
jgi:flagellar M-ring protein FliF